MDPERQDGDAAREPWVVRHGLLVGVALAAVTLLGALTGSASDADDGTGAGAGAATPASGAAPYGVVGCAPAAGAGPVDVAVTARALTEDGSPAASLGAGADGGPGGSGPEVGVSVRDLAGYAADGVAPCDVVQVTVHLHDPTGGGSAPGSLQAAPRPLAVAGTGGRGRLVAVDWSTWAASLPPGARAGDLEQQAAWFVTLVDAEPGTYRLTGRVAAAAPSTATGDVEVLVEVTPTSTG